MPGSDEPCECRVSADSVQTRGMAINATTMLRTDLQNLAFGCNSRRLHSLRALTTLLVRVNNQLNPSLWEGLSRLQEALSATFG